MQGVAEEPGAVTVEGREIPFTIIRSRRRRRTFEIRLDRQRGVLISVPWRTSTGMVTEHIRRRAGWILRRSAEMQPGPAAQQLVTGEPLPYLGGLLTLAVETSAAKRISVQLDIGGEALVLNVAVPALLDEEARPAAVATALARWYRVRALEAINESVAFWQPAVGEQPTQVVVRDQKRLWGSCGPDGTLRFNWRLIQLDSSLIDYVVVHELSHLKVRNHSPRFWAEVGRVQPDYAARRQRLRKEGAFVVL